MNSESMAALTVEHALISSLSLVTEINLIIYVISQAIRSISRTSARNDGGLLLALSDMVSQ